MAIPAVTTAALLSAPLIVLLIVFGHMATSAPTELCLDGCACFKDVNTKLMTVNCTSFRPILAASSSLMSDFSNVDVLNIQDVADGSSDSIIDGLFGVFSNVKYMNLINASISKINPNAFKGLKHLEELDLSKNKILRLRPESFSETPKLRLIDLSFNPLRLGPTAFILSKSVEDLILSSCNLTSIPAGAFRGLRNLKTLDLYDNHIKYFTVRSFPRNLRQLLLTKNNLTNVPTKALSSLRKLNRLDMSENPVNCTCSLLGLEDEFSSKGVVFENDVICRYPQEYKGESWSNVSENEVCFHAEETTVISKESTSENSCENESCDGTNPENWYIYNIQADQAPNEDATPATTMFPDPNDDDNEKNTISQMIQDEVSLPMVNNVNTTEENESGEYPDFSKSQEVTTITIDTQADSTSSPSFETLSDVPSFITSSVISETDENSDVQPSSSSFKEFTTVSSEVQEDSYSKVAETTVSSLETLNEPEEVTTVAPALADLVTAKLLTEIETTVFPEKDSTASPNELTTLSSTPFSSEQTTVPSTERHTETPTTVMSDGQTTVVPIVTNPTTDDALTTVALIIEQTTPALTTTHVPEVTTTLAVTPPYEENKEPIIPTTTTESVVDTTTVPVVSIVATEKIHNVPHFEEDVDDISTTAKTLNIGEDAVVAIPTKETDVIGVLPSTDNGQVIAPSTRDEEKPETMGSYIVLAGIIIILLVLILYASTKRGAKQTKKPFMDAENNMTELQDMTTLLPKSPVVSINGAKNGKYPDEEPGVTTKLLGTDQPDIPDSNGNGYAYPDDLKPDAPKVVDPVNEPNGKATLPRTNGSSNGAPPVEFTKAKVLVMHDSLPRTPIYIPQKNVNS